MSIVLERLTKRYDDHLVVNHVSLEIEDGEFFVLLGSSGSGKTTILNLIAGLVSADQGKILLHGRDVTWLSPQQRKVGFVFQSYALFQYMTVAENVEFGLSIRKAPANQRRQKRDELLEMVGLAGLGKRMPWQLSGGQQQRVALARALAYQPDVLLLDEPLGALDAKIRVELRRNLRAIQRRLGIATIFVTHDQEEAFSLADRIGIMSYGRLLEVGTPDQLYQRPQTEFVASFLGSANLLLGKINHKGVKLGSAYFPVPKTKQELGRDRRVQVLFRPEDVALAADAEDLDCSQLGQAEVEEISFAGAYERLRLRLPPISGVRPISPMATFGAESFLIDATRSPERANCFPLRLGDKAWVGVHRIHTLAHPGLNFLIVVDGSLRSQAAIAFGGQIGRLAHARVTLLGCGQPAEKLEVCLDDARKQLGGGLAAIEHLISPDPVVQAIVQVVEKKAYDLIVLGLGYQEDFVLIEQILQIGKHHLLLVPQPQSTPVKALICVAGGEPGKDEVRFAGRLVRHLSAEATLFSILPLAIKDSNQQRWVERFLERAVRSLALLGVPATTVVRHGSVAEEIYAEVKKNDYDLLVLGAPLLDQNGRLTLDGELGRILEKITTCPTLIVQSCNY